MANLSNYAPPIVIQSMGIGTSSGTVNVRSTGDASTGGAFTTAGSSGTGTSTSGPGGWANTSKPWSMVGFDGVLVTGILLAQGTTGTGASSGIYTMQLYSALGATSPASSWIALKDAYSFGFSTSYAGTGSTNLAAGVAVDAYRPILAAGHQAMGAVIQLPATSAFLVAGMIAQPYASKKYPTGVSASTVALGISTPASGSTATVRIVVGATT